MLPESPGGDCMSLQPYTSSCIILGVATQPTSNTQNTQFSPNSPNCQPSMGIWEPLANKLEQSYEIWCKAYTIPAAVCKYLPSPPLCRHAAPYRVSLGQVLSWERYTGIFDWIHFPIFLLVCFHGGHHITGREALPDKNGVVMAIAAVFNAWGVSRLDRMHGLSARGTPPAVAFEQRLVLSATAAMGHCMHPCSLSKLLLNIEWIWYFWCHEYLYCQRRLQLFRLGGARYKARTERIGLLFFFNF